MIFSAIPGIFATEVTEETTEVTRPVRGEFECGDDLTWSYADGVLTCQKKAVNMPWEQFTFTYKK